MGKLPPVKMDCFDRIKMYKRFVNPARCGIMAVSDKGAAYADCHFNICYRVYRDQH